MTEIEVTLPTTMPLRKFAKIAFGVSENTAYSRQEEIPTMRTREFATRRAAGCARENGRRRYRGLAADDSRLRRQAQAVR